MPAKVSSKQRILVVDDDRALRHVLATLLTSAGHQVDQAGDGSEALARIDAGGLDVVLLDIGLPGVNGLDLLTHARAKPSPPVVIMMTSDDTPDSLLESVRRQAFRYLRKPFAPATIVEVIDEAMAATSAMSIEVLSARPEWVELVAPCTLEMTDRIESFVMQLDTSLPKAAREAVAQAFRELLNNAIEWGGKLDPGRKVRISLIYRIADPGEGFDLQGLQHAAIANPADSPLQHAIVREEQGLRPGGLGLMMTQSLVDELIYNEARNEVMFIKYLD